MADICHPISLGSWSDLPKPIADGGWSKRPTVRGVDTLMADASISTDLFENDIKWSYELRWRMLSQNQYAEIYGAYSQFITTAAELSFSGLDIDPISPVTVSREPGDYTLDVEGRWINEQYRYDVSMRLREV